MKGDIKFISWFIKEWIERFKNNSDYISSLNTEITLLQDFPKIRFIDFIEGVDFHHYPSLITKFNSVSSIFPSRNRMQSGCLI